MLELGCSHQPSKTSQIMRFWFCLSQQMRFFPKPDHIFMPPASYQLCPWDPSTSRRLSAPNPDSISGQLCSLPSQNEADPTLHSHSLTSVRLSSAGHLCTCFFVSHTIRPLKISVSQGLNRVYNGLLRGSFCKSCSSKHSPKSPRKQMKNN